MKLNKTTAVILALIVIGGSYYWYRKAHNNSGKVQYVTAAVQKGTITSSVSGSGNVIVDSSSNIDPTITGTVKNLAVNIGDQVKKGQLLFEIDNNDLSVNVTKSQSSLSQAQSSLESAQASEKQASASYHNGLKKNAGTSSYDEKALKDKLEASKVAVSSSEKALVSARADLANQQINAAKRQVTSPIDGTVNAINIKNGDDLSKLSSGSSRTVPMIIGDLGTMKAQVQVNEVDIASVEIGQKSMITFSGVDGLKVSGKVEKMDSLGTLSSGVVTYNVTIDFDTLDPRIKPEMSVSAAIITDVKQDVLTIPNSALKSDSQGNYVEVLPDGGATPTQKSVTIGIANNTDTQITGGLNIGDKVITQTIDPNAKTTSTTSQSRTSIPGLGGGGGGIRVGH